MGVEIFFLGLPGWFIAILLYFGLSKYYQKRMTKTEVLKTV
jgi:hypothetical protein